jgi:hypothetical protein
MNNQQLIWILIIIAIVVMVICVIFIKYRMYLLTLLPLSVLKNPHVLGGCDDSNIDNVLRNLPVDINVYDLTNMSFAFDRIAYHSKYVPCYALGPSALKCNECKNKLPLVPSPVSQGVSVNLAYLYQMFYPQSTNIFVYKDLSGEYNSYFGPKMIPLLKYSPVAIQSEADWEIHFDSKSNERNAEELFAIKSVVKLCSLSNYQLSTNVILANIIDIVYCSLLKLLERSINRLGSVSIGIDMNEINKSITTTNFYDFTKYQNNSNIDINKLPIGKCKIDIDIEDVPALLFKLFYLYYKKYTEHDYEKYRLILDVCDNMLLLINTKKYNMIKHNSEPSDVKQISVDPSIIYNINLNEHIKLNNLQYQLISDEKTKSTKYIIIDNNMQRDPTESELKQIEFVTQSSAVQLLSINRLDEQIIFDLDANLPKLVIKNETVYELSNDSKSPLLYFGKNYSLVKMEIDHKLLSKNTVEQNTIHLQTKKLINHLLIYIDNNSMFIETIKFADPVYLNFLQDIKHKKYIESKYHWLKGYDDFTALSIYSKLLNKNSHLISLDYFTDWPVYNMPLDGFVKSNDLKNLSPFERSFGSNANALVSKKYTEYIKNAGEYVDRRYVCTNGDISLDDRTIFNSNTIFNHMYKGDTMHLPEYQMEMYTFGCCISKLILSCVVDVNNNPLKKYVGKQGSVYMNLPRNIPRDLFVRDYQ